MLSSAEVVHFDETGCSVRGERHWAHVAPTETVTFYAVHRKREVEAMEDMGALPGFSGMAIHDHGKPYFTFAHEVTGQEWAKCTKDLLIRIKDTVDRTKTENRSSRLRMARSHDSYGVTKRS